MSRGYFGIGIWHTKTEANVGGLWRSAHAFGASHCFTIGRRYRKHTQASDTTKAWKQIPLYEYDDFDTFRRCQPTDCVLVGVELCDGSVPLPAYKHPERAVYLLGAEDHGLSPDILDACHHVVSIPAAGVLNVASVGSIVLYDRMVKRGPDERAMGLRRAVFA